MEIENSICGNNFKRGARIYRVFSISVVQAFTHMIWMWGKLLFCCCFGTYLWQRNFPSVVLGIFHQQLSLIPTASIFCSLNGNIKSSSSCLYVVPRISFGCCGRFTAAELLSFSLSVMLVLIWVLTGHWLLMDGEYVNWGILLLVCACSDTSSLLVMISEIC